MSYFSNQPNIDIYSLHKNSSAMASGQMDTLHPALDHLQYADTYHRTSPQLADYFGAQQVVHSLQHAFEANQNNDNNNIATAFNYNLAHESDDYVQHTLCSKNNNNYYQPQPDDEVPNKVAKYDTDPGQQIKYCKSSISSHWTTNKRRQDNEIHQTIQLNQAHIQCEPTAEYEIQSSNPTNSADTEPRFINHTPEASGSGCQPYNTDPWYNIPATSPEHFTNNMLLPSTSNGREARNRAEKNRRDKIGGLVQQLSTLSPYVRDSPRRVDKTAVLRFAAHGMRINYVYGKSAELPSQTVIDDMADAFLRMVDTFLLSITICGEITLITSEVETHLGHCQSDLYGRNILSIVHPEDQDLLKRMITPSDVKELFDIQPRNENGEPRTRSNAEENEIDKKLREDKRNFYFRLARAGPRSEPTTYELVRLDGCFRRADSAPRGLKESTFPSGLQLIRRTRGKEDSMPLHTISRNDIVLIALVHVVKVPTFCDRLFEATKFEYVTRHLIDGRIVQCDQRISIVAGYMADEVCGLSPFSFMHKSDVRWVMVALRQMYDCSSKFGESCYRLIARNGEFIYLRTHGYLDINDKNEVGSFICRNTLVSEEEGLALIQNMKNRFVIKIKEQQNSMLADTIKPVEGPAQLERAIIRLIMQLPITPGSPSPVPVYEPAVAPIESFAIKKTDAHGRHLTGPLLYITPQLETIRVSIDRSVRVIEVSTGLSESDEDLSCGSPARCITSNDHIRTSTVKEQLPVFRPVSPQQSGQPDEESLSVHVQSPPMQPAQRSVKTPPTLVDTDTMLIKAESPTSPNESLPVYEQIQSSSRNSNVTPPNLKPTIRARLRNPIENKPREFCSNVGGFNSSEYGRVIKDSFSSLRQHPNAAIRELTRSKRSHPRNEDFITLGTDTFGHSNLSELSTKRRVLCTLPNPTSVSSVYEVTHLKHQLQLAPDQKYMVQDTNISPDSGVMSDEGSPGISPPMFNSVQPMSHDSDIDDLEILNDEFQTAARTFIKKTKALMEQPTIVKTEYGSIFTPASDNDLLHRAAMITSERTHQLNLITSKASSISSPTNDYTHEGTR